LNSIIEIVDCSKNILLCYSFIEMKNKGFAA